MNVTVQHLDGSKIYPSYAPEHKEQGIAFYADLLANGTISGYVITFDDGSSVSGGLVL